MFGIPSSGGGGGAGANGGGGASLEEEEELIRMGQLTPFGTRVDVLPSSREAGTSGVTAESASIEEELLSKSAQHRIPKKQRVTSVKSHSSNLTGDVVPSQSPSSSLVPNLENGFGPDDWVPSLADLLESGSASSGDSEYLTDDELGTTRKKKKRLRDLSSDGLSDEEEPRSRVRKGRRGKRKKAASTQRRCEDDGDEDLYWLRLR